MHPRTCHQGIIQQPGTGLQSFGNLAISAIADLLWTAVSPRAAFAYLIVWMLLALVALLAARRSTT